jgi:rod shape-determining protein MreD
MTLDALKAFLIIFLASILQASVFSDVTVFGGSPNLVLVALIAVALLRGSIFGALAGFGAGLLLDTAYLSTLGVTSLLLTAAGFWIGRYGETTGRDRTHAPFLAVAVVSVLYAVGALLLRFLLDEPAPARTVLVETLFPSIALNLILTWPVYALTRRLLRPQPASPARQRPEEVRLLG